MSSYLGAAPLLPLVIAAIDPLCTGHVGHPVEGEGEDAVTARVWTLDIILFNIYSKI